MNNKEQPQLTTVINPHNYSEAQEQLRKAQEEDEKALRQDFEITFATEWGQRVLAHLVDWAGVLGPSFVQGDTHDTAFNEGIKNTVRYILSLADRNNLEDVRCLWKFSVPPQGRK